MRLHRFYVSQPLGEEVVIKLIAPYKKENYILYTDSFYISPNLRRILHNNGIGFTGMVNANRYRLDILSSNFKDMNKGKSIYHKNV